MKGYPITINIYAESEQEAEGAREALVEFIRGHAREGRAVTGEKIARAVSAWEKNPFVRSQVINYFK